MGVVISKPSRVTVARLADWHIPYHDEKALNIAMRFCKHLKPDIILMDEVLDWYSLSRFDKDPQRLITLQDEIDMTTTYFARLRQYCPNARIILMRSNHLNRLQKYLRVKAPELSQLRALRVPKLLELHKHQIEFRDHFVLKDFLFKHGDRVYQNSAYTARHECLREGMSGMSGHTHRIGNHFVTKRGGEYQWLECGCLCSKDAEYIRGVADWQHGIGLVRFKKYGKHFRAEAIPIVNSELMWGDICISA